MSAETLRSWDQINKEREDWGREFVREQCTHLSDLEIRRFVEQLELGGHNTGDLDDLQFSLNHHGQKSPKVIEFEAMSAYLQDRDTLVTI